MIVESLNNLNTYLLNTIPKVEYILSEYLNKDQFNLKNFEKEYIILLYRLYNYILRYKLYSIDSYLQFIDKNKINNPQLHQRLVYERGIYISKLNGIIQ